MLTYAEEYAARRTLFLKALLPNSIAILVAAPECVRSRDTHYPYRPESNFYYLTGFKEPNALAVFLSGKTEEEAGTFILFNQVKDPDQEMWMGKRVGQEEACRLYGADQAFGITCVDEKIPTLMQNRDHLYYPMGEDRDFSQRVLTWLKGVQDQERKGILAPQAFYSVTKIIHALRLYKSPVEIAWIREAVRIAGLAHCQAMRACIPGMWEYELEAEIHYTFTKYGARFPAYGTIVGAGENSCTLHYTENSATLQAGDLVLIDAGAEYHYYASDITRTFPVSGYFNSCQRAIYEAVLKAQEAVIAAIRPGVLWHQLEDIAKQVITVELVGLGLLQGEPADLVKKDACKIFYMHKIGHWLGLDVHDVGGYRASDGSSIALAPGMILTVEPGIYIRAQTVGVDSQWWNIGVRIEDDVLVTPDGHEVLSAEIPKTVEAIENYMRKNYA